MGSAPSFANVFVTLTISGPQLLHLCNNKAVPPRDLLMLRTNGF